MNRQYTSKEALLVIEKLHKAFDMPYLGCDIIVGFPDETDDDFLETYENLKLSKLSKIHCFPYSRRENTPAYNMKNQIQDKIKTYRVEKILIQKKSPKTGLYSALTRNYITVHFKDENDNLRHTIKTVNLNDYELE